MKKYLAKVIRSYNYARFGWNNEDNDKDFIRLIKFKLENIQKTKLDNKADQSIRLCIRLCDNLLDYESEKYSRWLFSIMEKHHVNWWT